MTQSEPTSTESADRAGSPAETEPSSFPPRQKIEISRFWSRILQLGLGEISLKIGNGFLTIALVLLVVWVMGTFYLKSNPTAQAQSDPGVVVEATTTPVLEPPALNTTTRDVFVSGIKRSVLLHTVARAKPRFEVATYVVQPGDMIFTIAEKFNLQPETIFWGNPYTLADDPHRLQPGQVLNILPTDGVYYEWHAGDGLNGVAEFFGVSAEDIVSYEGNNLDPETIGDYANPKIEPGTWLIIPGGRREFINWSAPRITRGNPAVAKIYGEGYCGEVYEGPIGYGSFVWPAPTKWLSGYDFSPSTNHWGIDIGGSLGDAIYATDSGVVVYAGWNNYGYGNVVVIDHGNGWQSLYAHLSAYSVGCGSYVYQGDVIAAMGSTGNSSGPHLHFELRSDEYGRANPHNFLQ